MIDDLDTNHRVGSLKMKISNENPINGELINGMVGKYSNLYSIEIDDRSSEINNDIHTPITNLLAKA